MEYAIYDALRAGFDKLVLIIKREMYTDFAELFGDRIEKRTGLKIHYHLLSCSNYPHAAALIPILLRRLALFYPVD